MRRGREHRRAGHVWNQDDQDPHRDNRRTDIFKVIVFHLEQ